MSVNRRFIHVMKHTQKDPVHRSPSYNEGEQITVVTEDTAAVTNTDLHIQPGVYFEIVGKNPDTGLANPSYHLPTDGDEIYVMEIVAGQKVTIASHRWPLDSKKEATP